MKSILKVKKQASTPEFQRTLPAPQMKEKAFLALRHLEMCGNTETPSIKAKINNAGILFQDAQWTVSGATMVSPASNAHD